MDTSPQDRYLNRYTCPRCLSDWSDFGDATLEDNCPNCGCKNVEPWSSEWKGETALEALRNSRLNLERAARAEVALDAFFAHVGEPRDTDDLHDDITDLMTNLLHLMDREGIDHDEVIRPARAHHEVEKALEEESNGKN